VGPSLSLEHMGDYSYKHLIFTLDGKSLIFGYHAELSDDRPIALDWLYGERYEERALDDPQTKAKVQLTWVNYCKLSVATICRIERYDRKE
jgi:hypothetical protein